MSPEMQIVAATCGGLGGLLAVVAYGVGYVKGFRAGVAYVHEEVLKVTSNVTPIPRSKP